MTGIIVEGTLASAQDGNISFKALQEFGKTVNFARGDSGICLSLNPPEIFFCSHFICFLRVNKNKVTKTANGKSYRRFSSTRYFYKRV